MEEHGSPAEKEAFVTRLLSSGRFKSGLRLSRQWSIGGLQEEARDGYTKSAIDKFVGKAQVHLALQLAGGHVEYQAYVTASLVRHGNYSQARARNPQL